MGFFAEVAPGDNEAIGQTIGEASSLADQLVETVIEFQIRTGEEKEPSLLLLENLHEAFLRLPEPPTSLNDDILPRVFSCENPKDKSNLELLRDAIRKVQRSRELGIVADPLLQPNSHFDYDEAWPILANCSEELDSSEFSVPLNVLEKWVTEAKDALLLFQGQSQCAISPIQVGAIDRLDAKIERLEAKIQSASPLTLVNTPLCNIRDGASQLLQETTRIRGALETVGAIAARYDIHFDDSHAGITHFGDPEGIEGVLPNVFLDEAAIAEVQNVADFPLADIAISDLEQRHEELYALHNQISRLFDEVGGYSQQLYPQFDGTKQSVCQFVALAKIASRAPSELLDYRQTSLAHPRTPDLLTMAEHAHTSEKEQRAVLEEQFYLDMLPNVDDLKSAILTFRRGDRLFNFLNSEWRAAKKLFRSICKSKSKYKADGYETSLSSLVRWIQHHASFTNNKDFKITFGPLLPRYGNKFL